MPQRSRIALVRAAVALVLLAVGQTITVVDPDGAEAKPGFTVHPAESFRFFQLRGTNGYTVDAAVEGRYVTVNAVSRNAWIKYSTLAQRVDRRSVVAPLGSLGKFAMRFVPSGPFAPTTEPQGDCKGRRAEVQKGTFVGTFRWRGELNFSAATTRRVSGVSVRTFKEVCRGQTAATGPEMAERPRLVTRLKSREEDREVQAFGLGLTDGPLVGRIVERKSPLVVERVIFGAVNGKADQVDSEGNQSLCGDGRFRGCAELRADPGDPERWRGDLEGDFPGRGYVSLAGSSFAVMPTSGDGGPRIVGF
ncbi:MAG TPA: hypothetical protein VFJ61_06555 [Solirubrobacterales bacterium]|nr:hypothetical protein [Solirubrobacterales bacterium]